MREARDKGRRKRGKICETGEKKSATGYRRKAKKTLKMIWIEGERVIRK